VKEVNPPPPPRLYRERRRGGKKEKKHPRGGGEILLFSAFRGKKRWDEKSFNSKHERGVGERRETLSQQHLED